MSDLISRSELTAAIKRQYCTGCDNYNGSRCRACHADDMLSLVDDAVAAGPRWIPMEGKRPPLGEVLVCTTGRFPWVGIAWCNGKNTFETGGGLKLRGKDVSHWMPLPEPPKEE